MERYIYRDVMQLTPMTRITPPHKSNTAAVMADLFEMSTSREPVIDEIGSLLKLIGTHGSMIENVVVYENEEVYYVHTKMIIPSAELELITQY